MKIIIFFLVTITLFSCDPDKKDIFNTEVVKINATIESNTENINLGDTIKIKLLIPDTVTTSGSRQIIQTLQRGQFGMTCNLIDTTNKKAVFMNSPNIWITKGSREGNLSFIANTNAKPYEVVVCFKPPVKGLFLIEIISQAGQFRINNNYEARLLVNFNVPNKHLNILSIIAPYFGGQPFYDAAIQKDNDGFGNYYFRVN